MWRLFTQSDVIRLGAVNRLGSDVITGSAWRLLHMFSLSLSLCEIIYQLFTWSELTYLIFGFRGLPASGPSQTKRARS